MNLIRRQFLKFLSLFPFLGISSTFAGYSPSFFYRPTSNMRPEVIRLWPEPQTVDELIAWFELNFDCRVGYQGQYADWAPGPNNETNPLRTRYVEYAMKTEDTDRGRRGLVASVWRTFLMKLIQYPEIKHSQLYWRFQHKIELTGYPLEWEDEWPHKIGDRLVMIYLRIAVPKLQRAEKNSLVGLPVFTESVKSL